MSEGAVRIADADDATAVARLLRRFNTEYDDVVPEQEELADRMRGLIEGGETAVLLVGDGPDGAAGLAVLRFRQSIWAAGEECYLAELYVVPERRGGGLGRALLTAAIEHAMARGAAYMDLGTSEDDVAARALYESAGFINREGPDGPIQYVYERDL
jgi:ribosomal protein S18 acetylase RimI-like enzyme